MSTLGTMGDVQPFWRISQELVARGYKVVLLTNENWEAGTLAAGAEFVSIAPKDPPQSGRDNYAFFVKNIIPAFERMYAHIQARVTAGARLLLITKPQMLGLECAAEAFGLPLVHIALQPSAIKSFERPPWPLNALATGRWALAYRAAIIPLLCFIEAVGRYRGATNAFRRSVGLKPVHFQWRRNVAGLTLVLCPKWFAMPQRDWPENTKCVGFVYLPAQTDSRIADFVRDNPKPLVFTPGTGVNDVNAFFVRAEAVCKKLGRSGIFLSPHAALRSDDPAILSCAYADLGGVLLGAGALIHHGGIGTTAQALRAGVPQIIIPGGFDQPDNATRVAKLGLGAAIMNAKATADDLATAIDKVMTDADISARLIRVVDTINGQDGGQVVAQIIELVARKVSAEPA